MINQHNCIHIYKIFINQEKSAGLSKVKSLLVISLYDFTRNTILITIIFHQVIFICELC